MSDDERRLDEAIAWHVRLTSGDDADETAWLAFTAWLEAGDANRTAYDRVEDVEAAIAPATPRQPALLPFRRAAAVTWRGRWAAVALLAASLVLAVGIAMRTGTPSSTRYATRIGETRTLILADNSAVTLNTGTTVEVAVTATSRAVTLVRGEALFHVAKDAAHPFVVSAGDRRIRVVGTIFDVLRDSGAVSVVVAEGKVTVSQRGARFSEVLLTPGQRASGREGSPLETVARVDPARALAWRDGNLIYDNVALSSVVNDLNRYFPVPIALAGPRVAAHRFSGVLRIDNEDAVLSRIAQFLPVRAERTGGSIVLHDARKPD
jgi:transmembrane sensor